MGENLEPIFLWVPPPRLERPGSVCFRGRWGENPEPNLLGVPDTPAGGGRGGPGLGRGRELQRTLQAGRINATVRIERGIEIAAACGQLRTDVKSSVPSEVQS